MIAPRFVLGLFSLRLSLGRATAKPFQQTHLGGLRYRTVGYILWDISDTTDFGQSGGQMTAHWRARRDHRGMVR